MATETKEKKKRDPQGEFKCDICGKSYPFQGSLNIHKYHCEIKKNKKGGNPRMNECTHEFRLLRGTNEPEVRAMQRGFDEVCKKCTELR